MARYKRYNYSQMVMLPVSLENQLMSGTLEHAIHEVVETKIDTSIFESKYNNEETGSPAYDPKLLLKVILLAYSRGIIGSRRIERVCKENITFMAISCGMAPDHSTIASFVSSMKDEIIKIFRDILLYCEELNLLGGSHFSLDGCKLSSNVSKEWSGTFKELNHKRNKLEKKVRKLIYEHEREDKGKSADGRKANQIKRITQKIDRIDKFLKENEPKKGKTKKEIQSNVTDNESAKMPTSHGVIQGYNSQALVDDKHQVIVHAEAMGNGQDHDNLKPMLDGAKETMKEIGRGEDYFSGKQLSADANYHNEKNIKRCEAEKIDAYIPDIGFRKRDERYKNQERFKDGVTKRPKKKSNKQKSRKGMFTWEEFQYDEEKNKYICPNGKCLSQQSLHHKSRHKEYEYYRSKESDCKECPLKSKCIIREDGKTRGLLIPKGYLKNKHLTHSQKMQQKIDTDIGKEIYSKRLGTIEPVFANIRSQKRLDRFTYRGKVKVNIQWLLYCMVHNIEKICNTSASLSTGYGLAK
ncbi:IS1182 family transposase [Calditrichota bacterium]